MEQQKLPPNIDSEALKLTGDINAIANAYRMLADTVKYQAERIKELESKQEVSPVTED